MFYCTTSPWTITQRYKVYNIMFHLKHRSSFSMYHCNTGCSPSGVICQSTGKYHICFPNKNLPLVVYKLLEKERKRLTITYALATKLFYDIKQKTYMYLSLPCSRQLPFYFLNGLARFGFSFFSGFCC